MSKPKLYIVEAAVLPEVFLKVCEAKELLPHGDFYPWIEQVAGYKKSTANNFMRLFDAYGNPQKSMFGAEISNEWLSGL